MSASGNKYYCNCAQVCKVRKEVSRSTWYAHRKHRLPPSGPTSSLAPPTRTNPTAGPSHERNQSSPIDTGSRSPPKKRLRPGSEVDSRLFDDDGVGDDGWHTGGQENDGEIGENGAGGGAADMDTVSDDIGTLT